MDKIMMRKWPFVITFCQVQWVLAVLWILLIFPSNGYIINQEGNLVPFKVYKKGSYQGNRVMCAIHPRNCRGGYRYRKRTNVDAFAPSSDKLYELDVFKRKITQKAIPNILQSYDSAENEMFPREIPPGDKSMQHDLRDYADRSIPSNQLSYSVLRPDETEVHSNDKTAAVYNAIDNDSELYKQIVPGKQDAASRYRYQGIADPPPPDRQTSARLEKFPVYDTIEELITKYNEHSGTDSDIFDPNDVLSLFDIQKRR